MAGVANLAQHKNLLWRVVPQCKNNEKDENYSDESDCECSVFDKKQYAGIFHFRYTKCMSIVISEPNGSRTHGRCSIIFISILVF